MLQASSRSYVCWRCALRRVGPDAAILRSNALSSSLPARSALPHSSLLFKRPLATVQHPASEHDAPDASLRAEDGQAEEKLPIRERLRKWDRENVAKTEAMMTDIADMGELSNSFTRPQNVTMAEFDVVSPLFDGDELGDLRSDDTMLKPGDMVEMSSDGSRRPMLAIALGHINGYEQYFTSSGKWFSALGVRTLFVVHGFAEPAELEPIIAQLPSDETPVEALNALQDLGHGPSQAAAAPLLRRMLKFAHDAEAVYQANAGTLDASSSFIGHPEKHRYLTLHEIADLLLAESSKRDGKFEPTALYAVHRALLQDEVFFRPLKQIGHRRSYLFEVSPLSEVRLIQKVENMVRGFLETRSRKTGKSELESASYIEKFVRSARKVIDQSRKARVWTETGIIGPSKSPAPSAHDWTDTDRDILQFIQLWAGYQKFPKYSRLQTLGSTLLRAVDRYTDAEALTPSVGWTFLQEVGWIPPWEIPARYNTRFPEIEIKRGGGYIRPPLGVIDSHLKSDVLSPLRKTLDGLTAYCIDSETTLDIDDAVSLERTSNPNQYWIHVHVADPASSIAAETPIARHAELIPGTIYLSGHFERMLPSVLSENKFSLAADRPCLTFSALVDIDGTVLDQKIVPGVLKNVVYMTGENVASAIGESRTNPFVDGAAISVGAIPEARPPPRKMTRPQDVTDEQRNDLKLLSNLGRAVQAKRLHKGATPFFQPRPEAQAYFDKVTVEEDDKGFLAVSGDPSIRIRYSKGSDTDLVENAMRLAGEIAARWCHDRGIPIPYRTQPHALRNAALVQQYARDVVNPLLKAGIRPDDSHWRHMRMLIGTDEISTTPSPHFTIGADMYTKATSPLRRFSDLIVHWQIEGTMLEEHRRGESLVGNTDDSFLPFNRERLNRLLPMLRVRERQTRALSNGDGTDQWILQALVRAWRFGEADLPKTFKFIITHIAGKRSIAGRLNWFDRPAIMKADTLNNVSRISEIRLGDVFEVKLKDVNVHTTQIIVEAVKVLERAEDKNAALDGEEGKQATEPQVDNQTP
ncbi:hypothetical protein F5X99DRAFT_387647 [Biscogniauxia marginata]|nr:hypothetical protein F5X99DRAFT_387647 [Biscogniauxia marginata]